MTSPPLFHPYASPTPARQPDVDEALRIRRRYFNASVNHAFYSRFPFVGGLFLLPQYASCKEGRRVTGSR